MLWVWLIIVVFLGILEATTVNLVSCHGSISIYR